MRQSSVRIASELDGRSLTKYGKRAQTLGYFILAVLGFSFWFFMAVPFASHRETYWWLAGVHTHGFATSLTFISVTYRPLAQAATWLAYIFLNPSIFPTSVFRQSLLQGLIYVSFVLAWWLIYTAAPQRRLFALIAFVAGGVFFSGYVHLFHVYGIFYIPVMLTLGALFRFHGARATNKREVWFAAIAVLLVFWHPFATALFTGYYFGYYFETFRQRSRAQHIQARLILLTNLTAIAALVVLVPRFWPGVPLFIRDTAATPFHTRLQGFLVSYQTNEVNLAATLVAFLLTLLVLFSMGLSRRWKVGALLLVFALSVVFLVKGLPLLLLWVGAVLVKLFRARSWSLFFLALTAALFPFGAVIGTPIFALLAIIVGIYVTPLGWLEAENALSFLKPRYALATVGALTIVVLMVRMGVKVPIVTRAAHPLLAERERTYQLEDVLAWLHNSPYCSDEIAFDQPAGSPMDSLRNVLTRQHRPPAGLNDVQHFWNSVLRCHRSRVSNGEAGTAVVTFGIPALTGSYPVFKIGSRYAGDATVWIPDLQRWAAN